MCVRLVQLVVVLVTRLSDTRPRKHAVVHGKDVLVVLREEVKKISRFSFITQITLGGEARA